MLIPEVAELVRTHRLHEYDAEWIARCSAGTQMHAATLCIRGGLDANVDHIGPNRVKLANEAIPSREW